MKKLNFKTKFFASALLATLTLASCSDDDDQALEQILEEQEEQANASLVLNEVEYLGDRVELFNNGDTTIDAADYFLCLGPGTYRRIGDLETVGNTNIAPGAYISVAYEMPNTAAGLGLYINNTGFGDPNTLADFVQWGAAGSAREDVAVTAGIWTAGEFVEVSDDTTNSIIFDGEGNGAINWAETTTVTIGEENVLTLPVELRESIVFNEVQYGERDLVELYNNGDLPVDLSNYWLCLGPGTYQQIGGLEPVSGSIQLEPGAFLVLPYSMPDDQAGLGLYSVNQFANPEAIMDFVQYGAAGSAREEVAVTAGIWTAGDFVPTVRLGSFSMEYDGEGDASTDWSEEVNPSLGFANDTQDPTTIFDITISNVINYLNVHTFVERTSIATGASQGPGPLNNADFQYQISFQAVPGTRFTPVTMMGNSNDWFLSPEDFAGIDLFPNGQALEGDIAGELILFDLGTEADNMPENFPPAGANVGPADPDPLTRIVDRQGRDGATYITADLVYEASTDGQSAGTFTLTIRPVEAMLPDPDMAPSSDNGFVATPGIVVLHTQPDPLFTLGAEDRGVGLEAIAEDGSPAALFDWFNEVGTNGAPLRLASSYSVFSPGLVYAFNTERDPYFVQGETVISGSGLEELAEDGNNAISVQFLSDLGIPVVASNETQNIGPGGDLTFTIEVPQNQNYKLGIGTMLVNTNDWFISNNNAGVTLFDENGNPTTGVEGSARAYLYDAGTEVDQAVGFGADQAPRQSGPNQGAEDENNIIRRVSALDDVQYGKGVINNGPGTVYLEDPRGGYNVVRIDIQPRN